MSTFRRPSICRCNHYAPSVPEIRSVEFNRIQAARLDALNMSSAAIADMIWTELFEHRTGKLVNAEGTPIAFETDNSNAIRRYDEAVTEARRHFVKRYRARVAHDSFKNRLQERLVYPVTMMFLALEVRDCRLSGSCSSSALPKRHVDPIRFVA